MWTSSTLAGVHRDVDADSPVLPGEVKVDSEAELGVDQVMS